jgi:hypothetical protein
MFLRQTRRKKDGKTHVYWNIVENRRLDDGRVVQRQVLYLGEIHSSQAAAWRKAIEVFDEASGEPRTLALFPEDRCAAVSDDASAVRLCLSALTLRRPRQWGACWLAGLLWRELQLDGFWAERLPPSRKGTRWDQILQVLVAYRLIAPGSEWKLHRDWFGNSAMADLLGADFGLAEAHKLYACHDRLLEHKDALLMHVLPKGFHRIRHYGLFANGNRAANVARSRELLGAMPRVVEPEKEQTATPDEPRVQPCTCPRCGARMIIIEVFARGCEPRYRPTPAPTSMRIDTS